MCKTWQRSNKCVRSNSCRTRRNANTHESNNNINRMQQRTRPVTKATSSCNKRKKANSMNCAMMGLQATTTAVAGKRKLEAAATAPGEPTSPKNGRWEAADDCIARLRAVAVPTADAWRAPVPSLTATLLSEDEFDDDEFDDELSDEERCVSVPEPAATRFTQQPYTTRYQTDYWQYYQPPQQQTIRCEENGKSYLELGAAPPVRTRCCDGRTRWCHVPCYRQRRMAVLNLSMCKLARYRQCSDPSLRRSVLICNTLRRLEREMETEPPEPSYPPLIEMTPPSRPSPVMSELSMSNSYEQSLREMTCSGRATPFPSSISDLDSGLGDDDLTRPINWGSVLSLTSQTDVESLNNNELYAELGLSSNISTSSCSLISNSNSQSCNSDNEWSSKESVIASTSSALRTDSGSVSINEWDGFMHVLVGGT